MPEYDFLNLSPPEFEDLTRDLLQKEHKITLESFTSGRDNGIDLRYSTSSKTNVIVQCKRYRDFSSLIKNLKKEVAKVQHLNPSRYIISTSVGLTPNQKQKIYTLFHPYIIQQSDIIGRNDLNNLLAIHPKVEKQHFKLWLSSTNILDKILNSKIYNQSNFEEEKIKETINVYVDNESYYRAIKIIKDKKYVIISGIPGIGKTTLARILVYHYLANGFEEFIFLSDSINDAYDIYKDGVKQIFLFDDFLGTNFLENKLTNNEEQRIVRFIEKVSKSKDKVIILTTREYILAQAKQKYDAFNNPSLEFAKCIIDLSQYTNIVRAKILYNHLFFSTISEKHISNLLKTKTYSTIIQHQNYNPRIIQTITNEEIWKSITPTNFSSQFLEFIKNPTSVWKHAFENQISKLSQCVLANLMSSGVPILLDDLIVIVMKFAMDNSSKYGVIYSEIEFKKAIKELENTFIRIIKDDKNQFVVEYQNPSVQDFLVFYFKDFPDYITDILKSATYLNQFFTVFSFVDSYFTITNTIQLNNNQINLVANKIALEFDSYDFSVVSKYHKPFIKKVYSEILKIDFIVSSLYIDDSPELKNVLIQRFELIMYANEHQLQQEEIAAYVNLVTQFHADIKFDIPKILSHIAESIIDISEFEIFEELQAVFGEYFFHITSSDERHIRRITTLLELEVDNAEDEELEYILEKIIERAKKYKIDSSHFEEIIEDKMQKTKSKNKNSYDWGKENIRGPKSQNELDNETIANLFDSLRSVKKDI